jgi:hypothetical protein
MDKSSENLKLAQELKREVEKWVDSRFNYIPLAVIEKMAGEEDGGLSEYICHPEITLEDLSYDLLESYKADVLAELEEGEEPDTTPGEYLEEHDPDLYHELRDGNYPMWGTVFHFRETAYDHFRTAAEGAGFVLIEDVPEFEGSVILAVNGGGYSFFSAHWIPLYLAMYGPHNQDLRAKYAGVDYQMV